MEAAVEAAKSKRTINSSSNRYVANLQLDFTKQLQHLVGFQRDKLIATIRPRYESNEVNTSRVRGNSKSNTKNKIGKEDKEELE